MEFKHFEIILLQYFFQNPVFVHELFGKLLRCGFLKKNPSITTYQPKVTIILATAFNKREITPFFKGIKLPFRWSMIYLWKTTHKIAYDVTVINGSSTTDVNNFHKTSAQVQNIILLSEFTNPLQELFLHQIIPYCFLLSNIRFPI